MAIHFNDGLLTCSAFAEVTVNNLIMVVMCSFKARENNTKTYPYWSEYRAIICIKSVIICTYDRMSKTKTRGFRVLIVFLSVLRDLYRV